MTIQPAKQQQKQFHMFDVSAKRTTFRRAVATGEIELAPKAYELLCAGELPKGDVLSLAQIAGIGGAKKTADLIPLCHNLPLDQVQIHCDTSQQNCVRVYATVSTHGKTGVEMEALLAVQMALTTIWDLCKGTDPCMRMGEITLLSKEGGKSGVWTNPNGVPDWLKEQLPYPESLADKKVGILVMSDRAAAGVYEDTSGATLKQHVADLGAKNIAYEVVADDKEKITHAIENMCQQHDLDLLLTSGGTGPGPRDVTPEVIESICQRQLEGMGELLRRESAVFTNTAWLSRMGAGMYGATLIVTMPGSPKAIHECWEIMMPFIGKSLRMIAKQGFEKKETNA